MKKPDIVLGIETSCDDTAAAVVTSDREILSSVVVGQDSLHAAFGGVVPEIAARAHAEKGDIAVEQALKQANIALADIDAIAVTAGPGLIGGLLSGVMLARGLAAGAGLPIRAVNHLAGHALTPRLTDDVEFPYLMLLVSGGHCQFLLVEAPDSFNRLGGTIDDAPGEAFDKAARLLSLAQPGGPAIEEAARSGDAARFDFPRPLLNREGCDMSFSGLKTALLRTRDECLDGEHRLRLSDQLDLAASFQAAVADVLVEKSRRALTEAKARRPDLRVFAVAGGVASNKVIRAGLETVAAGLACHFVAPPIPLCTDNAAMIAWAAIEQGTSDTDTAFAARPRWPLDQSQPALLGSGKKGAKA